MTATIFLRFPDAPAFLATLPPGFEQHGETGHPLPEGVEAISIVGAIENMSGWHVNMLGTVPDVWAPYVVTPSTPMRVFGTTQ